MNCTIPNPEMTSGVERIGIQEIWRRGLTGAGVRVGHLDTGVDGSHPALRGRIAEFMEFDNDGFTVPLAQVRDSGSHGTHTAGIICGGIYEQVHIGVAPGAELCSGMVIEGGKCLVRLLAGLDWMLDCRVRVACLSLGVPGYHPLFEILLRRLNRAGVLVIAPIGNRGSGRSCSPANYPGVLAVGATDLRDRVARFSGSQGFRRSQDFAKPNLVAPGTNIPSARPGGGLHNRSGTSMAAAHVAGVAAILFQARPGATPNEVAQAILGTCTPLPGSSAQRSGRGMVNPLGGVEAIRSRIWSKVEWQPILTSD